MFAFSRALYSFTYCSARLYAPARAARRAVLPAFFLAAASAANFSLRRFFFNTDSGLCFMKHLGKGKNKLVQ
jgi:hypothetical protein